MEYEAYYGVETSSGLMHYGRKGMKWYQHIFGGRERAAARNERFETHQRYAHMSDSELQKRVNRMQAEKNFRDAAVPSRSSASKQLEGTLRTVTNVSKAAGALASGIGAVSKKSTISQLGTLLGQAGDATDKINSAMIKADEQQQRGARSQIKLDRFSDESLRKATNRINLETRYKQLTEADTHLGREYVDSIAGVISLVGGGMSTIGAISNGLSGIKKNAKSGNQQNDQPKKQKS